MSDKENFTPNPDAEELYTSGEIKPEYPTSHKPDSKDSETALAYNHAIKNLGLDEVSALDFAQLDESNRLVENSQDGLNETARREFKVFLRSGDPEWVEFWATREEEWEKLKKYIHSIYVKYKNRYDPEAEEAFKEMNEYLAGINAQSPDEIEMFFNRRPDGEREWAQYNDYRSKLDSVGSTTYAERPSDEFLEEERELIEEAQDALFNKRKAK